MKRWNVIIMPVAKKQLAAISDRRIQELVRTRLLRLEYDPDKQGKELKEELEGYRSVRTVGQRYRIIYKVEEEQVLVVVVTVGIRKEGDKKDAYNLAKKLARLNLLNQIFPENSRDNDTTENNPDSDATENSRDSTTVAATL